MAPVYLSVAIHLADAPSRTRQMDVNDGERSDALLGQDEPLPYPEADPDQASSKPTRGRLTFSRPRLHTDPVTRAEMDTALRTDPIKQFYKAPLSTSAYVGAWGAQTFGAAINNALGISRLAKTKSWRERQQTDLWTPELENIAEDPINGRPPFATVSGAMSPPPSPPASPLLRSPVPPKSRRLGQSVSMLFVVAGLAGLASFSSHGTVPQNAQGGRALQSIPTPEEMIDQWYSDKQSEWNTLQMCAETQQGKATPWASFGGDNFVTLAIKSVIVGDVLSETASSIMSTREKVGYRFAFSLAVIVVGMLGEVVNIILLLIVTFSLVFSGAGKDLSIFEWSGYLGCVGAMQSFVVASFICAFVFPVICVFFLAVGAMMARGSNEEDEEDEGDKGRKVLGGLVVFGAGYAMFNASVGFIIFVFGGIPSIFPMLGLLICALVVTCVLTFILMIPDILLSRLNGSDEEEMMLASKIGVNCLMTLLICIPRSAMLYGIGVSGAYSFTFTTIGSMPVHEEFNHEGIDMIFGGGDSSIYETTIQVAAWITLIKISVQCLILVFKYFHACCCVASL